MDARFWYSDRRGGRFTYYGLALLLLWVFPVSAQSYPTKPVRIVVALGAGGGVDTTARILAQKLTDTWGRQVVVDDRPGAGGTIATEIVARSAPDGYVLLIHSMGFAITPSIYKLKYDAINDFAPVTLLVDAAQVLVVNPSLPLHSVKELISFAKERPNELSWSSSGKGSPQHLALELLKMATDIKIVHVQYSGTLAGMNDLISNRVQVSVAGVVPTKPLLKSGRLRGLAVTGTKRSSAIPQLPTMVEAGVPNYALDSWYGMFAPAGTPKSIIARLQTVIATIYSKPDIRAQMLELGCDTVALPSDEFSKIVKSDVAKWAYVIGQSNATLEK